MSVSDSILYGVGLLTGGGGLGAAALKGWLSWSAKRDDALIAAAKRDEKAHEAAAERARAESAEHAENTARHTAVGNAAAGALSIADQTLHAMLQRLDSAEATNRNFQILVDALNTRLAAADKAREIAEQARKAEGDSCEARCAALEKDNADLRNIVGGLRRELQDLRDESMNQVSPKRFSDHPAEDKES